MASPGEANASVSILKLRETARNPAKKTNNRKGLRG